MSDIPQDVIDTLEICAADEDVDPKTYEFTGEITPGKVYIFKDAEGKEFGADDDQIYTNLEILER